MLRQEEVNFQVPTMLPPQGEKLAQVPLAPPPQAEDRSINAEVHQPSGMRTRFIDRMILQDRQMRKIVLRPRHHLPAIAMGRRHLLPHGGGSPSSDFVGVHALVDLHAESGVGGLAL
jgi:hypothetical protein